MSITVDKVKRDRVQFYRLADFLMKSRLHLETMLWIQIRKFLSRPDPNPSLFVRIRILPSSSKNSTVRKTSISNVFWLLNDFYLRKLINVPLKGHKQRKLIFLASWKPGSSDPDPYQNITDPKHCLKPNKLQREIWICLLKFVQCFLIFYKFQRYLLRKVSIGEVEVEGADAQ